MEYRADIQILRGIAVLAVILFHLQTPHFTNGFLGVDVFFVISGFLMARLYDRSSVLAFYKKRIDRLLPAYAITVVSVAVVSYFILVPADFAQLYEQALASIFFVNNIHFWDQNSYFSKNIFNPLLHLWSLSVEAQFYLLAPFLYPLLRKRRSHLLTAFAVFLFACLMVQTISPKTTFFWMPFRIWEFLIGAYVAWYGAAGKTEKPFLKAILPVLLIASFFFPLAPEKGSFVFGHPSLGALITTLLTGSIIYFGLPKTFENSLAGKFLAKTGDYSYSLYLIHFPIIVLINYEAFGGTILAAPDYQHVAAIILLIIAAAWLSYNFVERKYSGFFRTTVARTALLLSILVAATASFHLNEKKFSPLEQNVFGAWTDQGPYRCGKIFRILHPSATICPIGETDFADSILLAGDSHANTFKTSFTRIANRHGLNLYFLVSNIPLVSAELSAEKLVSDARELGIKFIGIHFNYTYVYDTPANRVEIAKLIALSKQAGIEIFLIAPVPTHTVHIPQAIYRSHGSFRSSVDRAEHDKRTKDFIAFAAQEAAKGLRVYNPADILCPTSGPCLTSDSQRHPYYFDSAHLTLTGAARLEPLFVKALDDLHR